MIKYTNRSLFWTQNRLGLCSEAFEAVRFSVIRRLQKTCHGRNKQASSIFFGVFGLPSARDTSIFSKTSQTLCYKLQRPDCQIKLRSQSCLSFIQNKRLIMRRLETLNYHKIYFSETLETTVVSRWR